MTILNENKFENKALLKSFNVVYATIGGTEKPEAKDDLIILGAFNYNTRLQSLTLSSSENLTGMVADLVLLDYNKNIFTKNNAEVVLKSNISFGTALNNVRQLKIEDRLKTLEEIIVENGKGYKNQVFIALKITTAPTTAIADVNILAETNFVDEI